MNIFLTGASSGIGEALAKEFAAKGATLGLVARRKEKLDEIISRLPHSHLHKAIVCDVTDREKLIEEARKFDKECGGVDVAIACDAAGVHVGSSDLPVAVARKLLGPDKIVGATAKTVEAAKKAYEDGADYLGVGAIFPTTTKVVTIRTSVETLNEICQSVPIPAVAIGGLNDGNMDILKGGKMAGVAVVSAIMKAEDPKAAAARMKEHVGELRG